jgi:nucleotide-binding universal stress UspA family protein
MSYKSILVHVDPSAAARQRYDLAVAIAEEQGAHLTGVAMTGVSRFIYQAEAAGGINPALMEYVQDPIRVLRERATHALDEFEAIARASGLAYGGQVIDDEAGDGLKTLARYSDLVVVGQFCPDDPSVTSISDLPEYVALASGRPVLTVPYAGKFDGAGSRVLVAWDGSATAVRAVTNAIPMLKHAQQVQVAVFNPKSRPGVHGDQPGADLALYLARHGIDINVAVQETDLDIGVALLNMASDQDWNMIVMGCYGHTHFREILLGGATRTMLESMTVPVLMSH